MNNEMTIAEKITAPFQTGMDWTTIDDEGEDICLSDIAENAAFWVYQNAPYYNPRDDRSGEYHTVYMFDDGSYIAVSGAYWDISEEDGTSWQGCILKVD